MTTLPLLSHNQERLRDVTFRWRDGCHVNRHTNHGKLKTQSHNMFLFAFLWSCSTVWMLLVNCLNKNHLKKNISLIVGLVFRFSPQGFPHDYGSTNLHRSTWMQHMSVRSIKNCVSWQLLFWEILGFNITIKKREREMFIIKHYKTFFFFKIRHGNVFKLAILSC